MFAGKRTDVVDFGGEMDYSETKWFQDAPPRRHTPTARQPQEPPQPAPQYHPSPRVIDQNDGFQYALSAAPNVLYQRYKQFGQLGVLGWCSEFSELIDNLKELGVSGNMFVTTREQALKTCEEILKLKMEEVKMQLVTMYLSSQVARLRRYLDAEHVWNDYPDPSFPLEPK
ncbi:hypothetical protein HYPSUDRAFT_383056 [Hypholoma sublateritium FD-334 SS-4]|uniref:Uncharacterized protein n=1 Tax=Hypholoma sublateritium (strain FD-334 SS-4) TaxID=945553 RepID=A0A0D2Q2N0_HYPSF|nr:hypothetical protein HYPSUDRAFT_383056 [Hypholoma sublateritium FD-334 SS-4]